MDLFSDVTMNDDEDRNSIRYFSFGEENFTKLQVIVPLWYILRWRLFLD